MPVTEGEVLFFSHPDAFRDWLAAHHDTRTEQWIGYYKKGSGRVSMTWPESVDEALCYGWIDGIRKSIDEVSYKNRFTPRKASSIWSAINLRRVQELQTMGRMQPAGLAAYERRKPEKAEMYAHERANVSLDPAYEAQLRAHPTASFFYDQLSPSDLRASIWWVMSAKQEATRQRRMQELIASSAAGLKIPSLRR